MHVEEIQKLMLKYTASQKTCHFSFRHNFDKCWPIFKILSLLDLTINLQQDPVTLRTAPQ